MRETSDVDVRVQQLMEAALELLDIGGYPADIGAHLDMAICRLRDHLGLPPLAIDLEGESDAGRLAV